MEIKKTSVNFSCNNRFLKVCNLTPLTAYLFRILRGLQFGLDCVCGCKRRTVVHRGSWCDVAVRLLSGLKGSFRAVGS
jgi:hypothetical protein